MEDVGTGHEEAWVGRDGEGAGGGEGSGPGEWGPLGPRLWDFWFLPHPRRPVYCSLRGAYVRNGK